MSSINDTLDNDSILSPTADLKFPHGYTYSLGFSITMIVVGIIGLLFITLGGLGYFAGPLFIFATVYTLSVFNGTEIALENGYIKA